MKKRINFLMIVSLILVIVFEGTACMEKPEKIESSSNSTSNGQPPKASSLTKATEFITMSDKKIVESVLSEYYEFSKADDIAASADAAMNRAEKLTDRYLGRITSEEDAKEKAEAVWMEIDEGILKYTKDIFERQNQPYIETTFYEKYDVWVARTCTSGITENGESFGLTGVLEIVIRKSDGKVLAI